MLLLLLKANELILKATIRHLADVRSGLTSYRKTPLNGQAIYLNARLFDQHGHFLPTPNQNLRDLRITPQNERYLLQPGDVLFAAKGEKNFAAVYNPAVGPAVASATFIVLRLRAEFASRISAPYLAWLLNHPAYQRTLKAQALGSGIPSISVKTLQQLEICVPDLPTQRTTLLIDQLQKKRDALLQQVRTLKNQLTAAQLLTTVPCE